MTFPGNKNISRIVLRKLNFQKLPYFSRGKLWFPTEMETGRGPPPHAQNFEYPPLPLDFPFLFFLYVSSCPFRDCRPHIRKISISNGFHTIITKSFACGEHFQEHNHDLFGKVRWN